MTLDNTPGLAPYRHCCLSVCCLLAAMLLLSGYLKASVTGTITIDNLALLDFAANVAQLNAELSDLLSRISKLNADAVTPLGLVKG